MYFPMFDDDGHEIQDEARRERYRLSEQAERIKAFLNDVLTEVGIEFEGVGDFHRVVQDLQRLRNDDADLAPEAERLLNRAATIDLDIRRHIWFIRRRELPIDTDDYFT